MVNNEGYPNSVFDGMLAEFEGVKRMRSAKGKPEDKLWHLAQLLYFNPDGVSRIKLIHYFVSHGGDLYPEEMKFKHPPPKPGEVIIKSLACSLHDRKPPKHDTRVFQNRFGSQCRFCGCYYENVVDKEVIDLMAENGIECSNERPMYDRPHNQVPCDCFMRDKAECIACGTVVDVDKAALLTKHNNFQGDIPDSVLPAYICESCIA